MHDGDHLPGSLELFVAEKKICSALCFFLGGVKEEGKIVVGPSEGGVIPPNPMVELLRGVHEVCGTGTIFLDKTKRPKLHMHASFGRGKNTITGCIRRGIDVWQIGEIVILELLDVVACREKDTKTGFELLEIKELEKTN
jgi:predicted DNA-binding protein with PD1-like motif